LGRPRRSDYALLEEYVSASHSERAYQPLKCSSPTSTSGKVTPARVRWISSPARIPGFCCASPPIATTARGGMVRSCSSRKASHQLRKDGSGRRKKAPVERRPFLQARWLIGSHVLVLLLRSADGPGRGPAETSCPGSRPYDDTVSEPTRIALDLAAVDPMTDDVLQALLDETVNAGDLPDGR